MKKFLALLFIALVFGIGGYLIGGVQIGLKTAKDNDIATLMWITAIDQLLQNGNIDKAKAICFDAAKIHFDLLKRLQDHPSWMLMEVLPWMDVENNINEIILTKAKIFYSPRASKMSPEAQAYLESIKEVPIPPSSCSIKTSTNDSTAIHP